MQLRFLSDAWACCELNDLNYLRQNQQHLRVDKYSAFEDRVSRDDDIGVRDIGKERIVLPSSHRGGPRYMKQKMQDCLALVRRYGKPDFFITFTCNPTWPEIQECKDPALQNESVLDIAVRVFKLKLDELLDDLFKRHVLGKAVAHAYVIEFQKRGLPHAHILLIVRPEDRLETAAEVNDCVWARIPEPRDDPELYDLVIKHMLHGRCDDGSHSHPCLDSRTHKCSKHFPKPPQPETVFIPDGGYPEYYRPERGPISDQDSRDNRWVVPYNPWLLKKYGAHLNVEICSSIKSVQYLYKYIYKGATAADFTLHEVADTEHEGEPAVDDEIQQYLNARWIGSAEAVWRLMEFSMGQISPTIYRLPVHLPEQNTVALNPAYHTIDSLDHERLRQSKLTEWFNLNRKAQEAESEGNPLPVDPRRYRYDECPEHYTWIHKDRIWKHRQRGHAVGRIYFVSPRSGDLFFLRLLLNNVAGATSYEDLCTFQGVTHRKDDQTLDFQAACRSRGLCDDDNELHAALIEGAALGTAVSVRHLFVSMLMYSQPSNPKELWEEHRDE